MNTRRVAALDGARAIAVGLVLLSHWMFQPWAPPALVPWLTLGAWGVQIFFVLSGFLITSILLDERSRTGGVSLRAFYIRRVSRIMPGYFVFLIAMLLAGLFGYARAPLGQLLASALYISDYVNVAPTVLGHTWSLAVEEQFYLLWPLLLLRMGPRSAGRLACVVVVLCPLVRLISLAWAPGSLIAATPYRFDTQADALAVGCLAALSRVTIAAWIDRSRVSRVYMSVLPLALLAIAEVHAVPGTGPTLFNAALAPLVFNAGVAAVLVTCAECPDNVFSRCLSWRPLAAVGLISYSLYLWQEAVWGTGPIVSILLAFALALASYHGVEKPLRRRGRAFAARVTQGTGAGAGAQGVVMATT